MIENRDNLAVNKGGGERECRLWVSWGSVSRVGWGDG